ncbi:MAG: hypothetical protein HYR72_13095 [Deltaproteobacteria bacterium]|nr:hypothetical protein [Deltaproteobacteria bacterium]MBI3386847.1 hypothetical protein [Deltaproteobacteria bacterium]
MERNCNAIDESQLDPVGGALLRLGVLAYGLTADREWVATRVDVGDENGSARRAYIRVMLSFIEGMNHALSDVLLAADKTGRVEHLSVPEIFVLHGVQFQVDTKGRARAVRRPLRLKDSVRLLLKLLGRCADAPFEPNFGDEGWRAFLDAIAIRNRVTHPRTRADLWLTEEDLERVDRAIKWYEDETAKFLQGFRPRGKDKQVSQVPNSAVGNDGKQQPTSPGARRS